MEQSAFETTTGNFSAQFGHANGESWENAEVAKNQQGPSTSIGVRQPAKFYRRNREKMLAISSSTTSQRISSQRSARLRRLHANKSGTSGTEDAKCVPSVRQRAEAGSSTKESKRKSRKAQPPPLTPNQIMIRKLFERINRAYKASLRESVKHVWKENRDTLDFFVKKHHSMQSAMATTSILLSQDLVDAEDIFEASMKEALHRSTTAQKIKVIVSSEKTVESITKAADRVIQKIPVTTLGHVSQIPPVLDWTAIPHNLHEDDGKFLTNIPFLGDEFIDKDAKFIDEMVTLYEGKVHEAKDSSSFRKMDDEVLYSLVQAMIKIEAEEGPDVFKEEQTEETTALKYTETMSNADNVFKEEKKLERTDGSKKITFSDVAAKLFQSEDTTTEQTSSNSMQTSHENADSENLKEDMEIDAGCNKRKMEVDLQENQYEDEQRKCIGASALPKEVEISPPTTTTCEIITKPSEAIFALLSSTFNGLGTKGEIKERYENAEKAKNTPMLPILPNGMEKQNAKSYSIPNIEGPFAKCLPKEATMHAYHVLFCRRCYTYDCKRHTGDDQLDVKFYKSRQKAMSASTSSSLSSSSAFNFLCTNPDCWQMNDTEPKSPESILPEWSPSDRSLFSCFIDSFPSNYCFIAYMMRNKTCAQVKEYADLEHVPKMESCSGGVSARTKGRHRKQRVGCAKKSSGHSHTKRSVTRRWINNVKKTEKSREEGGIKSPGIKLPPRYMPCLHENGGPCDASCTCRINKTSCEKFCTCALTCPYRFPGCKCLSTCDSKRCICFAAARECDPDLCFGCGAHEHSLEKISCHNVNIQRKLHKHLLMGRSDISGWGIYIKNDAQKGEFIAEYRGELISHDESERRGHVYDKIQHTFLFELNDHFVVDATRKGNKARFVNSSKNPNCEVKRMLVNGDHRIGIYAKRFIEAGEELFYDYEDVLEKQQKAAEGAATRSRRE